MLDFVTVGEYWKEKFGTKVYRISIDAGFTCPTRDGKEGKSGCFFCDEDGARPHYVEPELSIRKQVKRGRERLRKRGIENYIAYFQAYTNTYAPSEKLKEKYKEALAVEGVLGISVSTRPDCLNSEVLSLLNEISEEYYVLVELGIQTGHQESLDIMGRGHTVEDSRNAVELIKKFENIEVLAHLILGLPGENHRDMMETAETLSKWGIRQYKLHHLYVVKNSPLERMYEKSEIQVFNDPEVYADIVSDFIDRLPKDAVIHRLAGYCPEGKLIAPSWTSHKNIIRNILTGRSKSSSK